MTPDSAFFAAIWAWMKTHTPDVLGVFLAMVTGALRSAYTGEGWRRVLLEGALCGAICMTIDSSLDYVSAYLHIPGAPSFVGGMIGFIGVERIRALVLRRFDKPLSEDNS
ncbi:phage holin, lambda family [Serratia proteamaculans]|uniref:phage holin, lambda family n=1 Tax=Serratia proteamaculans TaxID=28151 RepID=UPI002177D95C|nr:phage holin, lambda family [Serratia proteamaculans]CAI0986951.1 phage holin, lambda family [Serratia proteamaculans]